MASRLLGRIIILILPNIFLDLLVVLPFSYIPFCPGKSDQHGTTQLFVSCVVSACPANHQSGVDGLD